MAKNRSDPPRRSRRRDDEDEVVGYGRPPKAHQFRKGQSGNPKGRPKGSRNLDAVFTKWLERPVPLTIDGRETTLPAFEAMVVQMINRGLKGDPKSFREILSLVERRSLPGLADAPGAGAGMSEARRKLAAKLDRLTKARAERSRREDDEVKASPRPRR